DGRCRCGAHRVARTHHDGRRGWHGGRGARLHVPADLLARGQRGRLKGRPVPGPSEFPGGASRGRIKVVAVGRLIILGGAQLLLFWSLSQGPDPLSAPARLSLVALVLSLILPCLQIVASVRHFYEAQVAMAQLLIDQVLISVLVYLSGGVASGATSLYGLSCLAGGLMLGVPGAVAAALAGGVCFSLTALIEQSRALPISILPPL